ncbi:hypothetical protein Tco_1443685 [Tanacetum coccineum]
MLNLFQRKDRPATPRKPKEDRPETSEPDWIIPPNDLPDAENNWASSYQDPDEFKLLRQTSDMGSFINWFCKRNGKKKLSKADLEGPTFKVVQPFHDNNISLQFQMEECHLLLTDQVDLVNPEGHRVVPNMSKPLPLGGPPVWILSVVSLRTYERYRYAFLKEIVLHRANYNEYKISEADFKNLHSNDFEDLNLLHIQGQLNHLSGTNKVNLYNVVNLWIRNIIIKNRVEDLQLGIENKNDHKKMMRETKVHKFSDGTLNRILDKLDHMVKDFKLFKYNPGMETRIWSKDDRRRSKEFMEVIERRLKIRRIFRNLKSFIGRRLRDVDYRLIPRIE